MNYLALKSVGFTSLIKVFLVASSVLVLSACGNKNVEETGRIHIERAQAYQDQGQYKAAVIEYKNAVQKSEGNDEAQISALVSYAEMLNSLSQYRSAQALLESYSGDKNAAYYLAQVEAFIGLKKFLSAQKVLKELKDLDSGKVKVLEAKTLLGLDEISQALSIYESLLDKDATNAEAQLGKAGILLRQEKFAEAKSVLNAIEKNTSAYVQSRIFISNILISENQLEEAEATLSDVLSLLPNTDMMEPDKALVLERLSYVLTRLGRSNEAYIYTRLLAEAFPGVNEMNERFGQALEKFRVDDLEKAHLILTELVSDFPSSIKANQLLGIVSYLKGDHEQALEHFSGTVDPEIADPLALQFYAASSLRMNEPKKVLALLEDSIAQIDKPETIALYGLAAISDKQYEKGEEAIKRAISLSPENHKLHSLLANYYCETPNANSELELSALKQAYKVAPTEISVLQDLLRFYLRNNKSSEANAFITELLSKRPDDYATQLLAGYYYASTDKAETAHAHFTKATELEAEGANYRRAQFAKGRMEVVLDLADDAITSFSTLTEKFPKDSLGYRALFSVWAKEDRAKAYKELEKIANDKASVAAYRVLIQSALQDANSGKANNYLAKLNKVGGDSNEFKALAIDVALLDAAKAADNKEYTLARDLVAPVLVQKPNDLRMLAFLVELEIKAGNLKEANKVLDQLRVSQPNASVITMLTGDLAIKNNEYEQARSLYEAVWKHNKNEVVANKLFHTLGRLGAKSDQSLFVSEWLRALPNSINATIFKAVEEQSKGNKSAAKEAYERVLVAAPDNTMVLNNLGWIYYESGDKKSLDLLARAAELAPENPAILDSYGWVLAEFGKPSEGLPYLEKASKLAPNVKEISEHLAQVQAKL